MQIQYFSKTFPLSAGKFSQDIHFHFFLKWHNFNLLLMEKLQCDSTQRHLHFRDHISTKLTRKYKRDKS